MVNAATKEAKDYVISTGRMETIRKFIELTAKQIGWNKNKNEPAILWEGDGINEIGRRADNNKIVIRVDPKYFRPTEVEESRGDSSKAYKDMGWEPKYFGANDKRNGREDKKEVQKIYKKIIRLNNF